MHESTYTQKSICKVVGTALGVKAKRSSCMNLPIHESSFGVGSECKKVITHKTDYMHESRNPPTSYPSNKANHYY